MKLKFILCCLFLQLAYSFILEDVPERFVQPDFFAQEDLREMVFTVLREKCNICHATKKKTTIFTLQNMDSLAPDIHKQVFIKKKMPKGRKIKLTFDEQNQLKDWLDETLIKK